jgi:flavorubredoxin
MLVDTGMPVGWPDIRRQLRAALGSRTLTHLFPTHPETPHMGNLELLAEEHPEAVIVGDLRNYHLYLPHLVDRMRAATPGDAIDLGGRSVHLTEAPIHDLPNTMWGYDSVSAILFTADAYAYSHAHGAGECALTSEELAPGPTPEDALSVIQRALHWPRYVDTEHVRARLDPYLKRYPPAGVAPAHGGFVTEPERLTEVYYRALAQIRELA